MPRMNGSRSIIGRIGNGSIIERRTRLRKLQLEAEQRHTPDGFEPDGKIVALAIAEVRTYFQAIRNLEAKP